MTLVLPAPAKLNLFLYIIGRRPDGYHLLQTLFQFLDYSDTLTLTATDGEQIRLLTPLEGIENQHNLLVRAAELLKQATGCTLGVDISIQKCLPIGGGIGGGSSNAATVLLGLNRLWQTGLTLQQLAQLGLTLGADVPIFIHGHAAFAEGVGDQLQTACPTEKWYLVAHPGISISTPSVFSASELPRNSPKRTLDQLLRMPFSNDCEAVVRKRFYKVEWLLSWLLEYAPARLTGTGACVFAEFETKAAACEILNTAPDWVHGFVARGVNVSPLHRVLSG